MLGEFDPDRDNLDRVRKGLRSDQYDAVRMECYNRDEAQFIWSRLTAAERSRVHLTWLTFGVAGEDRPLDPKFEEGVAG